MTGPQEHFCKVCGVSAPYGFGFKGEEAVWACGAHRVEVEDAWRSAIAARVARAQEAMKPRPAPGRLL